MKEAGIVPVMNPLLPTFEQYTHYLRQIDQARIYSNRGPLVKLLESRYAGKLGMPNPALVVLCSNATLAIQGFLQISEVNTWHVPSFTFAATVHAAIQSGKQVIMEDIIEDTWMISPDVIKNPKLEGIVPVLPFGAPFNPSPYSHLSHVLIDAAASIGGARAWVNNLQESWAAVFSLHATKSFGIGEGGLIVFGSEAIAAEFRSWINFGFLGSRDSVTLATNAKLSEFHAAVGLAVLDNWDVEASEWSKVKQQTEAVTEIFGLNPIEVIPKGTLSPYWIISHIDKNLITRIEQTCLENHIETRKWWSRGCHWMPPFKAIASKTFSNTDKLSDSYLGLPMSRNLSESDIFRIKQVILDCI